MHILRGYPILFLVKVNNQFMYINYLLAPLVYSEVTNYFDKYLIIDHPCLFSPTPKLNCLVKHKQTSILWQWQKMCDLKSTSWFFAFSCFFRQWPLIKLSTTLLKSKPMVTGHVSYLFIFFSCPIRTLTFLQIEKLFIKKEQEYEDYGVIHKYLLSQESPKVIKG